MSRINVLSDADVAVIKELVAERRNRPRNMSQRPAQQAVPPQAPEVYAALTPVSGVLGAVLTTIDTRPALEMSGAECDVYTLDRITGNLTYAGFTRLVYNLSCDDIAGNTFVLVERDKFGAWYFTYLGCAIDPADLCGGCAVLPYNLCVTLTGLSNVDCPYCDAYSSVVVTMFQSTPGGCNWEAEDSLAADRLNLNPTCTGLHYALFPDYDTFGGVRWLLDITSGDESTIPPRQITMARYTAPFGWNCIDDLVMTRINVYNTGTADNSDFFGYCSWPDTVTVTRCTPPTTPTGTGTACTEFGWFDQFTDADSTDLMVHIPDLSPCGALYTSDFGTWDIQSGEADPSSFSASPTQAAFVFDPLLTSYVLSVDLVWSSTVVNDFNNFVVFVRVDGAMFPVYVALFHVVLNSWLLVVSDGTTTDSNAVTLIAGNTYTLTVTVTPTSVQGDINSITSSISSTVQASFTPVRIKVQSTNSVPGCVFLDNLSVF